MERSVITIGNFDGVHRGHQAILARAAAVGAARGVPVVAITFDPHPAAVLRPGSEPPRLMDAAERVAAIRAAGADEVEVLEPTRDVLDLSPRQFLERLVRRRRPIAIVEGTDFRFGKDRRGDVELLRRVGPEMGFEVVVAEQVHVSLWDQLVVPVHSSMIRWLLAHGRVADAARCLGRPYALAAPVVRGEQRGRGIGVPTANLGPESLAGRALPADGVYAGTLRLKDGSAHASAISIGVKPTFERRERVVEAHVLDFDGDLYGGAVTLRFTRWLRDQERFASVDALRAQLERDIARVRAWRDAAVLELSQPQTTVPL